MILYRMLLRFDLLFAAACAILFALGVVHSRPGTLWFMSGLMAVLGLFIGGGMWLGARGRFALANLALGIVALAGGGAIILLWVALQAGGSD